MNWILEHILDAATVGVLAWLASLPLKRAPASARYGVWMIALVKFALPSGLLVLAAGWAGSLLPGKAVMAAAPIAPVLSRIRSGADFPPIEAASHAWLLLLAVWLAGAVWVAAATIIGHRRMRRRLERNSKRAPEWLRARMPEHVRLLVTREPVEPVQWGIRRPSIALPEEMLERLTPQEVDSVLQHELAHVKRRDNAAQVFEAMLAALFWFHPALWWIERRVQEERERACDEAVIGAGGDAEAYASAILKICKF
ncbi:MAG TPA: M56 family metallopeptidase, partial [Bryobacteraceae bacterium]|nr:M56 family metallopeptidase [Bryobacteraceae bacterium]